MFRKSTLTILFYVIIQVLGSEKGYTRQCFQCRSRGELGDCGDPFPFNRTSVLPQGVKIVPCPSGWCSKTIEGIRNPPEDYGTAVERQCLQQSPPDNEERCAELVIHNKLSLLCVCKGTNCNHVSYLSPNFIFVQLFSFSLVISFFTFF